MSKLIDINNIGDFIKNGGKFLFTDGNREDWKIYINSHIKNAIYFPGTSLRTSNTYHVSNCKACGIVPVQQIDVKSIVRMLINTRLSRHDKICVYGGVGGDITSTLFVYYTLVKFGLNMYYLNMDWKTLPIQYLTQEIPVYKKICEKYKFSDYDINAEKVVKKSHYKNTRIIDVRSPAAYSGEQTDIYPLNGHIPTAINVFWNNIMVSTNTTPAIVTQTFKSKEEITKILNDAGIYKENDIILSCNTSSESTTMFFAITDILGWNNIKIFQGSWNVYQYLSSKCPNKYQITTGPLP
jgi:3-mercaptopyruvate sulfurtransferase SseA